MAAKNPDDLPPVLAAAALDGMTDEIIDNSADPSKLGNEVDNKDNLISTSDNNGHFFYFKGKPNAMLTMTPKKMFIAFLISVALISIVAYIVTLLA